MRESRFSRAGEEARDRQTMGTVDGRSAREAAA